MTYIVLISDCAFISSDLEKRYVQLQEAPSPERPGSCGQNSRLVNELKAISITSDPQLKYLLSTSLIIYSFTSLKRFIPYTLIHLISSILKFTLIKVHKHA